MNVQIRAELSCAVVIESIVMLVSAGRLVPGLHGAKIRLLSLERDWLLSIRR